MDFRPPRFLNPSPGISKESPEFSSPQPRGKKRIIREKKPKRVKKRAFSLKIQTKGVQRLNPTLHHTRSGSLQFKNLGWKINSSGVRTPTGNTSQIDSSKVIIISKLGTGGQSEVFLSSYNNKHYALKIFYLDDAKHEYTNSRSEVDILRNIKNTNRIVRMEQAYTKNKRICLILEYMDCGSLLRCVRNNKGVSERILSLIAYQMIKALEYLHTQCLIIHRDVKPSNFLVHSDGLVKLTDFGVSKKLSDKGFYYLTGTKKYKSPQCFKFEKCTFKCDMWGLGVTLAELFLGKYPLKIDNDSFVVNLSKGNFLEQSKGKYSKELYEFLDACVRMDASKRPSATQLLSFDFIKKYNNFYDYDRQAIISNWARKFKMKVDTDVEMKD